MSKHAMPEEGFKVWRLNRREDDSLCVTYPLTVPEGPYIEVTHWVNGWIPPFEPTRFFVPASDYFGESWTLKQDSS